MKKAREIRAQSDSTPSDANECDDEKYPLGESNKQRIPWGFRELNATAAQNPAQLTR